MIKEKNYKKIIEKSKKNEQLYSYPLTIFSSLLHSIFLSLHFFDLVFATFFSYF